MLFSAQFTFDMCAGTY